MLVPVLGQAKRECDRPERPGPHTGTKGPKRSRPRDRDRKGHLATDPQGWEGRLTARADPTGTAPKSVSRETCQRWKL